jgi:hypothetical protein
VRILLHYLALVFGEQCSVARRLPVLGFRGWGEVQEFTSSGVQEGKGLTQRARREERRVRGEEFKGAEVEEWKGERARKPKEEKSRNGRSKDRPLH